MTELDEKLVSAASAPILLVACDFDGTLSPIASSPGLASPDPHALAALNALAQTRQTFAAIVSGRGAEDLAGRAGQSSRVRLIGSHGAEGEDVEYAPPPNDLLRWIEAECRRIIAGAEGFEIEPKPFGVAVHYRHAKDSHSSILDAIVMGPGSHAGVHVIHGLMVVELSTSAPGKGLALDRLRKRLDASCVFFAGDDVTDEFAFESLGPGDVGIKVGPGNTKARYRVPDQQTVGEVLERLLALRRTYFAFAAPTPIEHHAMLSDQRTIALLDPQGRIVWMCSPRIDSGAIFAELIGGPGRGVFEIEPIESSPSVCRQHHLDDSWVLRTQRGSITITDYFDCSAGRPYQRAGRSDLIRIIEGTGRVRVRFAPRLDFGRVTTRVSSTDAGLVVEGAADPIALFCPGLNWSIFKDGKHDTAVAEFELSSSPVVIELRCGAASLRASVVSEATRREQTIRFWSGWAGAIRLPGRAKDAVRRSALVIKALCHGPTGALAAAGTTSLPAPFGGSRNWDYRYCWPRDASLAAAALLRLGNTGTAIKLLDWLTGVVERCESPERLRPIYTVSGSELGPEAELGELHGYGGSRPVRLGNAAANQVQLDMFGPIVDLVATLAESGAPITPQYWRIVEAMVQAVYRRWREPDHGIWEIRDAPKHHVHSKVMCWQAVSRAIVVAEHVRGDAPEPWRSLQDDIHRDVMSNGWSEKAGAFTVAYGFDDLDAAVLQMALTGFLAPDDSRLIATVRAVSRVLLREHGLMRYTYDDGLQGLEGAFNICTAWLIESLAIIGEREHAEKLFERLVALCGPTGMMPEQVDIDTGLGMGNYPQVYSHLGLINAAVRLWGSNGR